jgi:hypothetical protein
MSHLFNVDERLHEARALLEVVVDGLTNDVVGINQEHYATTVRLAANAVESAQESMDLEFRQRREERQHEAITGYAEQEYDHGEVPGWRAKSDLFTGEIISGEEPEESEREEETDAGFSTGSLGVKLVEEHDDGSATFEVHGSKEQMGKLFSAFFTEAIIQGIDCTQQSTEFWVTEKQIIGKAKQLSGLLLRWEVDEELDYDPEIKQVRRELTDLFIRHDALR